jgi:hypothetical protein
MVGSWLLMPMVQVLLVLLQVKAGVGATGIMLFINTRTNQCCVARLGNSMPFVAASKGRPILRLRQPAVQLHRAGCISSGNA